MGHKKPHIAMVAGCPRSGSTIIGKVLSLSSRAGYLEEPLNPQTGIEGTTHMFVHPEGDSVQRKIYDGIVTAISQGNAQYKESLFRSAKPGLIRTVFYKYFTNLYHFTYKLGVLNPLVHTFISKDPTASFATQYLHRKHGYKIILTLRHPCAVVASHLQLGWHSAFGNIQGTKSLEKYLSQETKQVKIDLLSEIEALAWYWRAVNEVLYHFALRNPSMIVVEHEHFSRYPVATAAALYRSIGLPFTGYVRRKIIQMTSASNPTDPHIDRAHTLKRNSKDNIERWRKHLSPSEVVAIEGIASKTYTNMLSLPNLLKTSNEISL